MSVIAKLPIYNATIVLIGILTHHHHPQIPSNNTKWGNFLRPTCLTPSNQLHTFTKLELWPEDAAGYEGFEAHVAV
jgi:hypothetical protein